MQNQIIASSGEIISQLIDLCKSLTKEQFSKPLELLSGNTVGRHVRHVIEFYDLLKNTNRRKTSLSYDIREHCVKTESNPQIAIDRLINVKNWIGETRDDCVFNLQISYDKVEENNFKITTNLERELVYNIEHAIHHMAIIRIAIENEFDNIKLDKHFGIAYSTIRFRDDLCAR